jgi:hypothetical protein
MHELHLKMQFLKLSNTWPTLRSELRYYMDNLNQRNLESPSQKAVPKFTTEGIPKCQTYRSWYQRFPPCHKCIGNTKPPKSLTKQVLPLIPHSCPDCQQTRALCLVIPCMSQLQSSYEG